MMGYGLDDDGLHGPNERFSIEMFHRGIETAIVYLEELAQMPGAMGTVEALSNTSMNLMAERCSS